MRVAIYARVSTEDKGQDPENQLRDLRAWCANSGHELVGEYVDRVSGRKGMGEGRRGLTSGRLWAIGRTLTKEPRRSATLRRGSPSPHRAAVRTRWERACTRL